MIISFTYNIHFNGENYNEYDVCNVCDKEIIV